MTIVRRPSRLGECMTLRDAMDRLFDDDVFRPFRSMNGGGYEGLVGEAIPLAGRIVAVADVFDALTQKRPYKAAWPIADAVEEIRRQRGRQFDPALVDAFLRVVHRTPAVRQIV